jgi:hypothetical protein
MSVTHSTDVLGLVYAAAFVPDQGETLAGLGTGFKPPDALNHLIWTGTPFAPGSLASIDPAFFRQDFAQDLPAKEAAALGAAQIPIAVIPVFSSLRRPDRSPGTRSLRGTRYQARTG